MTNPSRRWTGSDPFAFRTAVRKLRPIGIQAGAMQRSHNVTMLGTGLIGLFYTMTLHGQRGRDRVRAVYSRTAERAQAFASEWDIAFATSDMAAAIRHPDTDTVVIGLPNHLHEKAVRLSAEAGKAVLCTKPLARTGAEAKCILDIAESAGIFAGYLEDLVYTPKTLKALASLSLIHI